MTTKACVSKKLLKAQEAVRHCRKTGKKMKRLGNIFNQIISCENLERAFSKATKNKKNRKETRDFLRNKEENLKKIQRMLEKEEYRSSEYNFFTITDSGKEREIAKLPLYPDRVIHWALMLVIRDRVRKHYIKQTYSAIRGRGSTKALIGINRDLKRYPEYTWFLKIDIKKYFPSLNKDILMEKMKKLIKDKKALNLIKEIIYGYPLKGIPIGNYTSQAFGNIYLSDLDRYIKETLRVKIYHRYMDDMVLGFQSKKEARQALEKIEQYVSEKLKLRIKENKQYFPIELRGVDFVGYRSFGYKTILRSKNKRRIYKIASNIKRKGYITKKSSLRIVSYNGLLKKATGKYLKSEYLRKLEKEVGLCKV